MIESFRTHPYTRAVCLETARLFERRAATDLVEAQCRADEGASGEAQRLQAKARLAQQRAQAWHLRAQNAFDGLVADDGRNCSQQAEMTRTPLKKALKRTEGDKGEKATAKTAAPTSGRRERVGSLRADISKAQQRRRSE